MRALLKFTDMATFSELTPASSIIAATTIPGEPMDDYNLSLTITLCVLVGVAIFMSVFAAITIYKHRRPQNFSRTASLSPALPHYLFVVEFQLVSPKRGLTKSALRALPKHRYEKVPDVENQYESCVICLTDFEDGAEIRKLPDCSHEFHVGCVDKWLRAQPSCPCCRRKVGVVPRSNL